MPNPNRPPKGPSSGRNGKPSDQTSTRKPGPRTSGQSAASTSTPSFKPTSSTTVQPTTAPVDAAPFRPDSQASEAAKKRRNRGARKKRNRRQSFAMPAEDGMQERSRSTNDIGDVTRTSRPGLYRLGQSGANMSSTSLESEALLDHRDQQSLQPRRQSIMNQGSFGPRPPTTGRTQSNRSNYRPSYQTPNTGDSERRTARHQPVYNPQQVPEGSDEEHESTDRTPLISSGKRERRDSGRSIFAVFGGRQQSEDRQEGRRDLSVPSSTSSRRKKRAPQPSSAPTGDYDVNNPPSVPTSPKIGPEMGYGDPLVTGDFAPSKYPDASRGLGPMGRDSVINIESSAVADQTGPRSSPPTPTPDQDATSHRRRTVALPAEGDVCFPIDGLSEIAEDDAPTLTGSAQIPGQRRRKGREWPDLSVLDEWSREEKEERSEGIRAKKISEPVLVGGRLRPAKTVWHRTEEDLPYRFTYFNEEFQSTIHSQTISELLQPGQSFRELFIPDPPELTEDESAGEEDLISHRDPTEDHRDGPNGESNGNTRRTANNGQTKQGVRDSSGEATPVQGQHGPETNGSPKRQGARPTFWLDVLSPTDAEMRVISKTFGIHPLTAEDIMMQEAREKVELFRNYYFVNYRTFEQDLNSEDFLEPINMYYVVFREGVISFHFSMVPHAANVRRRIRQLKDYLILSSDWISYAIIDDITDAFAPLIQTIEDEVDDIDDAILQLHSPSDDAKTASTHPKTPGTAEKKSEAGGDLTSGDKGGDMLRRVGDCRKKVMGLYRLLGNKADVIKGFAKRCNEQWDIAPRSEIGLYLGDIQDHIITMTSNLSHYEKILSRSHSNYLAQINIRMNERQEQTADVLGRLTVLGTIVLPMNIITGLWGMNCLVPGQDGGNLTWFWSITGGLLVFGFMCYFIAKRVYGIV